MNILILQKNTGKAGAQNSLRRLLMSEEFRKQNVVVVTGTEGWFVDQVKAQDIPVISVNFPSSRSIYGRIIGNSLWLYSVTKALKKMGFEPDVLQANNHVEAIYLKMLKNKFRNAATVVFLRDGYIREPSYLKYQCHVCDIRVAVSRAMADAVSWDKEIAVINNGVFEDEIYPASSIKPTFPRRWLVIGNPNEGKGWFDFLSALSLLNDSQSLSGVEEIVFTGVPSGELLKRYESACAQFSGKVLIEFSLPFENLGQACQNFDVVISPSRRESFGMAMLEACCSGKCVVSSKTGIAESIISNSKLLFTPGCVNELAACLKYLLIDWHDISGINDESLQRVRQFYSVEENAKNLVQLYRKNAECIVPSLSK